MNELLTAIETLFNATSGLNSVNGPWLDKAPQGDALPYCIMVGPVAELERWFGGQYVEETELQFSIFASTKVLALTYINALNSAFDRVALSVSAGLVSRFVLIRTALTWDHTDKNGDEVYHARSHFTVRFQPSF